MPREKFPVRPDCHIGLIPIGEPVDGVKTKGLRWNLDGNQERTFPNLVFYTEQEGNGPIYLRRHAILNGYKTKSTPSPITFVATILINHKATAIASKWPQM